ncbi:unnamed protein product [Rhizophagus irregularis]|nr:unnamed protein product [Rhizophagus irregularis]
MPPLQQTQKEKHQGRRTNPYRRPRLPYELIGSQSNGHKPNNFSQNTVENEWQNMTSNEFGDNTNDYDDNEKPSIKQVSEPKVLMVASLENSSRRNSDINTKRGATIGVEQIDSLSIQ